MNIVIDSEFKNLIPALLPDEFKQLESNIVKDGCHEPLSVWVNDNKEILIDGHNRKRICEKHDISFTTKKIKLKDREHVKLWIGERQLGRRNLTDDQRAVVANDVRESRSAIAAVEHAKTARAAQLGSVAKTAPGPKQKKERVRTAVAKEAGLPERKIRLAQEIKKASPAVHEMVRAGKVSLTEGRKISNLPESARKQALKVVTDGGNVRDAVRTAKREDYNERIAQTKPKVLEGTYRILYADPPWKYVGLNQADEYGHAEAHYECLDDIQLAKYKPGDGKRLVRDMMDKNSVLFMWVTSPLLHRCFAIIKEWGFEYKSSFVWDKVKHNMGFYNSVRHEFLIIATRGSCKPDVAKLFDSVQEIERTKHSRKPEEFYKIIETLYDHGRKLELFSRTSRKGWDMDGNEQEALQKAA